MGRGAVGAILGSIAVTIAFTALAFRGVDLKGIVGTWASVQIWPWVPLAIGSYLAGHVVRGIRCRILFRPQAQLTVGTSTNIVVIGYACNNILPLRLGELVRGGMLSERTGAPYIQSLAIIFVERLLDGVAILALLMFSTLWLAPSGWVHQLARTGCWVFGLAVLGLLPVIFTPSLVVSIATRLGAISPGLQTRLVQLAMRITTALQILRNPLVALQMAGLSLTIWTLESGLFAFLLPAFHLRLPAITGLLAMAATNLGIMVPSSPGFIGPFHYFCQQVLVLQGIPAALGLSYATAVHLAFYIPVTLWGASGLVWYGVEVGTTLRMARRARQASEQSVLNGVAFTRLEVLPPRPKVRRPASRLVQSLVEALVAPGERYGRKASPEASGAAARGGDPVAVYRQKNPDPELVAEAAEFLLGEIEALPTLLRIAVAIGLTGFRVIVFATRGRPFCSLPLATRKAVVESWAYGPFGLARTFFKPLRSIACMAYYERLAGRIPRNLARREAAHG
jgi:uncharacterized protein (TIRG00374 family)